MDFNEDPFSVDLKDVPVTKAEGDNLVKYHFGPKEIGLFESYTVVGKVILIGVCLTVVGALVVWLFVLLFGWLFGGRLWPSL